MAPPIHHISDPKAMKEHGLEHAFASINFNFTVHPDQAGLPEDEVQRARATASEEA